MGTRHEADHLPGEFSINCRFEHAYSGQSFEPTSMNAFPALPLKSETISTTIARFRAQRADKHCRPRNDRIHLGRETLLTGSACSSEPTPARRRWCASWWLCDP